MVTPREDNPDVREPDATITQDGSLPPRPPAGGDPAGGFHAGGARFAARRAAQKLPEIAGYRITGVLGQGGMGVVYSAVQLKLNRTVALKVLPAIVGNASPSAVTRFRREASAAGRLHHTNIVPIYDFGESREGYHYAMELVDGRTLADLIPKLAKVGISKAPAARVADLVQAAILQQQPTEQVTGIDESVGASVGASGIGSSTGRRYAYYQLAAKWMADAAEALHYAHGQGITHRDIKPANLILSCDGRIMIADFGLAKTSEERSVTMTGSLLGTVRYLSPEQAMAKRVPIDHRTDVYALAATMYELLCFQPAFPGTDDRQILATIISRDPVAPRKIVPAVPPELETICLKGLEKDPGARYPTAHALAEDLRRFMHDLPIDAKRPGPIARAVKFARRRKAVVVAGAAVLLLAVAIPVFVHFNQLESRRRLAAEFVARAQMLEKQGRPQDALYQYEQALQTDRKSVDALVNLARLKKEEYNRSAEPDDRLLNEAVELCDRALAIQPENAAAWNARGVLLKKLGQFSEAVAAYGKALELASDNGLAWENLGIVHALAGELDSAEKCIRRATEIAGTTEFQCEFPWRNLASLELLRGKPGVMKHIDRALLCNRRDAGALLLRARLLMQSDRPADLKRALEDADHADFLADGRDPRIKRIRALAHLKVGDYQEAREHADAALRLGDQPATANHLVRAIAAAALGTGAEARQAYQRAATSWPDDLRGKGQHRGTAEGGVLWFDTAADLLNLDAQARRSLEAGRATP